MAPGQHACRQQRSWLARDPAGRHGADDFRSRWPHPLDRSRAFRFAAGSSPPRSPCRAASHFRDYLVGVPGAARDFAATPAKWAAVRAHAGPDDRVGNNPLFMRDDAVAGQYLLGAAANRRSCYAGYELALPYVPLARERLRAIDAQFIRVFAGEGDARDLGSLVERYHCRIIVVTPRDGAWHRDAFAASPRYRLLESDERWRIYLAGVDLVGVAVRARAPSTSETQRRPARIGSSASRRQALAAAFDSEL